MGILDKIFGTYSDKELKTLLADAKSVFPDTILTKDRMTFNVPLKD